ncbi:hypothetical protein BDY21DRAFT_346889 [Lineolata rhizophorae]|uniref:Uncharacterized protein n=1 Tax=Lineolata rhizophorae TaxID=578093 RepID=A0A6A6NXZ7_9PEZI|nr:hypothetical protein BDY21DRAFT_346889 [Lineolata rhizophorae]
MVKMVTFAFGYFYSAHEPGTAKDADFWFLIQGCTTQLFSLVVAGLILRQEKRASKLIWGTPTGIALISTILAIPLYLMVPTEWSAFLVMVGARKR